MGEIKFNGGKGQHAAPKQMPISFNKGIGAHGNPFNQGGPAGYTIPDSPELYRLLGDGWVRNGEANKNTYNDLLALNQPILEHGLREAGNFGSQFLAGFTAMAGANDIPDIARMAFDKEKMFGNALTKAADKIRSGGGEVYHTADQLNSMSSPHYWMNQVVQAGFSVGIFAEALAEQFALSAITASSFGAGTGLQALRTASMASKWGRLGMMMAHGAYSGIKEGYMNGIETQQNTYREAMEKGMKHEDAVKVSAHAASLGFKMEVLPLMTINALQMGLVGVRAPKLSGIGVTESMAQKAIKNLKLNTGFSGGVETILDPLTKGIKNKFAKGIIGFSANSFGEMVEEGIQTGISQYATLKTLGREGYISPMDERHNFFNKEMVDSMVGGALGGSMMHAIGSGISSITGKIEAKKRGKAIDTLINNMTGNYATQASKLNTIKEEHGEDSFAYRTVKRNIHDRNVIDVLMAGEIYGDDRIMNSHVANLNEVHEAAKSKDLEALKKFNLTAEDIPYILEEYPTMLERVVELKDRFDSNIKLLGEDNKTEAANVTLKQAHIESLLREQEKIQSDITNNKVEDASYNALSPTGKTIFDNNMEIAYLTSRAKTAQEDKEGKTKGISTQEVERLKTLTEETKALEEKPYTEQDKDAMLFAVLDSVSYMQSNVNKLAAAKLLEDAKEDLTKYLSKDKGFSSLDIERDFITQLRKAKTKEEIEAIRKKAEQNRANTTRVNNAAQRAEATVTQTQEPPRAQDTNTEFNSDPDEGFNPPRDFDENQSSDPQIDFSSGDTNVVDSDRVSLNDEDLNISDNTEESVDDIFGQIGSEKKGSVKDNIANTDPTYDVPDGVDFAGFDIKASEAYEEHKKAFDKALASISEDLGREAGYIDFLRVIKKVKGLDVLESNFDYFAGIFTRFYNVSDSQVNEARSVFLGLDGNLDNILNLASTYRHTIKTEDTPVETVSPQPIVEVKTPKIIVDDSNVPVTYTGFKTTTGDLKAGYTSIENITEVSEDEQGVIVSVSDLETALNDSTYIDSKIILDPEQMLPGTNLSLTLPSLDILAQMPVSDYGDSIELSNGTEGNETSLVEAQSITFEAWCKKYNVEQYLPNGDLNPKWVSKVPIIASNEDGKGVFYIHDTEWYNMKNISQFNDESGLPDYEKQREVIDEGRKTVMQLRQDFLQGKTNKVTITLKTGGFFKSFPNSQVKPLSEIFKGAEHQIKIEVKTDANPTINGRAFSEGITNQKEFESWKVGTVYEIREGAVKGEFTAMKVFSSAISSETIDLVMFVLNEVYSAKDSGNSLDALQIKAPKHGRFSPNDSSYHNLTQFLHRYLPTSSLPGAFYFSSDKGFYTFGRVGSKTITIGSKTFEQNIPTILRDIEELLRSGSTEEILAGDQTEMKPRTNVSRLGILRKESHYKIVGGALVKDGTYVEHVQSITTSNTMAFNIGTEEKPKYATKVQPSLYFEAYKNPYLEEEIDTSTKEEKPTVPEVPLETLQPKVQSEIITNLMASGRLRFVKEDNMNEDC